MALTDKQLEWILRNRLSNSNGFRCGTVFTHENGVSHPPRVCTGKATIYNGKLTIVNSCGEPCDYVCSNTRSLADELNRVVWYERIIEAAKRIR